jgi:hypothetical protein
MNFGQKLSTALLAGAASSACLIAVEPANAAQMFNLSETRSEDNLFNGANTFPENTFTFNLPQLASNSIDFSIAWNDLDTDYPFGEGFDVELTDQLGNTTQIFDEIDANLGGNGFNSDGAYQKSISLGTKAAGSISFDVFADGSNFINNYSPEGSMTLSVSGQKQVSQVPESSSLLGLLAVGVLGAGTTFARKKLS